MGKEFLSMTLKAEITVRLIDWTNKNVKLICMVLNKPHDK